MHYVKRFVKMNLFDSHVHIGQAGVRQLWSSGGSGCSAEEECGAEKQCDSAPKWKDQFCRAGMC